MSSNRNAEFDLLLLCARMEQDDLAAQRIRTIAAGVVEWNILIGRAHEHRVLPLVCRTLERLAPDIVPEPVLSQLRRLYRSNATRNLSLTAELLRLIDAFAAQNINCIPYKGPFLAATAYGDVSMRQFADLDIIVPADDVRRALDAVIALGYEPEEPGDVEALSPSTKDIVLHRDSIELELHWGITTDVAHPIQVTSELVWNTAQRTVFRGRPVYTFDPETNLLVHCIHGVSHAWQRMGWVCDIAGIVRSQPEIDWARVDAMAAAIGARRLVRHSLALARTLFDVPIPPAVVRALESDTSLPALTDRVTGWLATGGELPVGELQRYYIDVRENTRDKLWVLYRQGKKYLALTERDSEALPLERFPSWLLYLRRPFRLAREYGLAPFFRFLKGVFQV